MKRQRTRHKEASPLVLPEQERALHDEVAGNMAMSPALNAAMVVDKFHALKGPAITRQGGVSITALADKIERAAASIRNGDLAEVEQLLLAQAHALSSIFTQYALRSASSAVQDRASELLLLAIKAQAASRATLATLVDLKFPRTTVIAKQANLAQGHQQVNNAPPNAAPATPTLSSACPVLLPPVGAAGPSSGGVDVAAPVSRARTGKRRSTEQTDGRSLR